MRTVRYKGPAQTVGRHGHTETGDKLVLSEQEWLTACGDPRFELLEDEEGCELVLPAGVEPQKTVDFDLTSINWKGSQIYRKLNRLSIVNIRKVAKAMRELGFATVAGAPQDTRPQIVDSVLEHASRQGWTGLAPV